MHAHAPVALASVLLYTVSCSQPRFPAAPRSYVNVTTQCGLTPLHYAALSGHEGAAARLLALQPHLTPATRCLSYDSAVGCEAGSTPLHVAAARGHTDVARAILQHYVRGTGLGSADQGGSVLLECSLGVPGLFALLVQQYRRAWYGVEDLWGSELQLSFRRQLLALT